MIAPEKLTVGKGYQIVGAEVQSVFWIWFTLWSDAQLQWLVTYTCCHLRIDSNGLDNCRGLLLKFCFQPRFGLAFLLILFSIRKYLSGAFSNNRNYKQNIAKWPHLTCV